MITVNALSPSNASSMNCCLGWGLVCQRAFLGPAAPLASGFLCVSAPERLSPYSWPSPRSRLLLLDFMAATGRFSVVLVQTQSQVGPIFLGHRGWSFLPVAEILLMV